MKPKIKRFLKILWGIVVFLVVLSMVLFLIAPLF